MTVFLKGKRGGGGAVNCLRTPRGGEVEEGGLFVSGLQGGGRKSGHYLKQKGRRKRRKANFRTERRFYVLPLTNGEKERPWVLGKEKGEKRLC